MKIQMENQKQKMSVTEFLESRPELADSKRVVLRFLEEAADNSYIESRPKGRSFMVCEFDCGAYKGSEIIRHYLKASPLLAMLKLQALTSGHHFDFSDVEAYAVDSMQASLEIRKG